MKKFVNFIQLIIIAAIVYPIFHFWDVDKVNQLCRNAKPGMSKSTFIELAHNSGAKITGPTDDSLAGGKWTAIASSHSPFADKVCEIKGIAAKVATVEIVEK